MLFIHLSYCYSMALASPGEPNSQQVGEVTDSKDH